MCVALPGEVTELLDDKFAKVDFNGNIVEAATGLVDVKVGDKVLVHAGCIIQTVSKDEADELEDLFKELGAF
ncbi:MAG: HypC/HybG/HupF family hydrogenase formation chaperone [Lachnospiraceae bacterium]|nr:HypC/HybG/HupF family hydrogenase formation chaperone [Lachnospiraceae bacterium]